MSGFMNATLKTFLTMLVLLACGAMAEAQISSTTGSGSVACQNGGFNWQVDQAPITTTVTGQASFNMGSNGGCLVQVSVNIPHGTTVHEVHGNMSLTTFNSFSGGCGNGSAVAQLRDLSTGNVIASMKLGVLGPNSANVPISASFATPLSVSSFQFQYFVDVCGPQTINVSLVMS